MDIRRLFPLDSGRCSATGTRPTRPIRGATRSSMPNVCRTLDGGSTKRRTMSPNRVAEAPKSIEVLFTVARAIREKKLIRPAKHANRHQNRLPRWKRSLCGTSNSVRARNCCPATHLPRNCTTSCLTRQEFTSSSTKPQWPSTRIYWSTPRLRCPRWRNWLLACTELRPQRTGIIMSLLLTCRLQAVDPYTYLVDVMQRVGEHPEESVIELTTRVWETMFAGHSFGSDLLRQRSLPTPWPSRDRTCSIARLKGSHSQRSPVLVTAQKRHHYMLTPYYTAKIARLIHTPGMRGQPAPLQSIQN